MKEMIDKIKDLKKNQLPFCYSMERKIYNDAIDDVIRLLEGKERKQKGYTGPK